MKLFYRILLTLLTLAPLSTLAAEDFVPVAGKDYIEIPDGHPFAPLDGKVEVTEVFSYTCSHCAHFEPVLEKWLAQQPKNVRFIPVPGAFGGYWDAFARAYYAADILGVAKRSHLAMYQAIHDKRSMPVQNVAPEELAAFYADYGVPTSRFIETLKSDSVEAKIKFAREYAIRSRIRNTPSLIINGRYVANGRSFEDMLRVADYLIAREAAQTKTQ